MTTESHKAKDIFVELVGNVPPDQWEERGLARAALKIVRSDQCGHVESSPMDPAGKPWKGGMITDGKTANQENDRRSFLPALGTPIEPAINGVVLLVFAGRGVGNVKCLGPSNSIRAGSLAAGIKSGPLRNSSATSNFHFGLCACLRPTNAYAI